MICPQNRPKNKEYRKSVRKYAVRYSPNTRCWKVRAVEPLWSRGCGVGVLMVRLVGAIAVMILRVVVELVVVVEMVGVVVVSGVPVLVLSVVCAFWCVVYGYAAAVAVCPCLPTPVLSFPTCKVAGPAPEAKC